MPPSAIRPIVRPQTEGDGDLRRPLYSGLVVIGGVTLAFVAVAVSLALNG